MRFSLGVNYWPRDRTALWEHFDPGLVGADFAHVAGLELDTIRIFVRWDLFAPAIDRVDSAMLDRLATVVTLASDAGLRVVVVLLGGCPGERVRVPDWARERGGALPVAGNIYGGALLDAQVRFARAAGERLAGHPGLAAWDIGDRFTDLRRPSPAKVSAGEHSQAPADEAALAQWSRRLAEALRERAPVPVTAGTFADDLIEDRNLRLSSLCAPFTFASMQADNVALPFARNRLDPEALPFLAMLTAAFSYKPVLVTAFGNPTCPPGKFSAFERFARAGEAPNLTISPDDPVFAAYPCLTEDENAYWCTNVLERLHADGRLGAFWKAWSDAPSSATGDPLDVGEPDRTGGLVRADGTEKPVAGALAAFARQRRETVRPSDMPMIASAYYYRTLPTSTTTLFDAFLRFVQERRTLVR